MLKLKLQSFGHLMQRTDSLEKTLMLGKIEGRRKRGKQSYDYHLQQFMTVQFSSVTQSCPTLCDPMNCSTPGFPVLHHLPELAQTRAH